MGSVIRLISGNKTVKGGYSLGKQKTWLKLDENSPAIENLPLGKAERVTPKRFCNVDVTAIVIP